MAEREKAKRDPFSVIEDGHLSIKTKKGELKTFILNRAQKYVLDIIKKLWHENKIIRLWILKARQLGLSTLIEAVIYVTTSQRENINSLIVADDDDGVGYIFEMSKLYHEKCPAHIKVKEKKSNEKKLEFDGIHSQILIDTARNKNAGRNYTFQAAHLSNWAYFPYPDDIMSGLNNSVPALPRTMIIKETTGKGSNFAKDEWNMAKKGKIDYVPIFIPWYWDDGYVMDVDESFIIGDESLGEMTVDEPMLFDCIVKEGIDKPKERLAYRRWKIKNDCKGDVFKFKQEFPSNDEEAFEGIVGNLRFNIIALNQLRRRTIAPIRGDLVYKNGEVSFEDNENGICEVYNYPNDATKCVIGADIAEGKGKDRSSASVLNLNTLTEDIVLNTDNMDPAQFAIELWKLGHWCNKALIAIENNGPGLACILPLRNGQEFNGVKYTPYRNLYYKDTLDESKKKTRKFGWTTSLKTKPVQIDKLAGFIREGIIGIPSLDTIRECQFFVIDEEGRCAALEGNHDDRVMALSIACMMYDLRPKIDLPKEAPEGKRRY